ncbi:M15 family metallopeptidase [Cellulomonas hominis]
MVATTTMNGWSLTDVPLATVTAGDRSTEVRAGDTALVLAHVAQRFHHEVEPIETFHGWRSVATNAAVGGHPRSNHPSGTAIDLNGARHPYKQAHGFSAAQVAAIRAILAEVSPVVRWGGDFGAALLDGMHFEIVGTAAQVAAVAARLTTSTSSLEDDMPSAQEIAKAVVDELMGRLIIAGDGGLPQEVQFGPLIGDMAVHVRRAAAAATAAPTAQAVAEATLAQLVVAGDGGLPQTITVGQALGDTAVHARKAAARVSEG